jgi:uncharacterized RDD family membrane protein YckC
MYCTKCGKMVADGMAFCPVCGMSTGLQEMGGAKPTGGAPSGWQGGGAPRVTYGGFWLRFLAAIIDGLVLGIPAGIVVFSLFAAGIGTLARRGSLPINGEPSPDFIIFIASMWLVLAVCGFLVAWLYGALMESSTWQATLGKKALGLMVTDMNGSRVSFARATGRHFGKIVSGNLTLYIGFIMAGFTEKKQALHDMMAGCLVVRRSTY